MPNSFPLFISVQNNELVSKSDVCVYVLITLKTHEFNLAILCSYYPYWCLNCPIFYPGGLLKPFYRTL